MRPSPTRSEPARRALLRAVAGLAALGPCAAAAIGRHGRVEPPDPAPEVALLRDDGVRTTLPKMLLGRTTAMHFMFTGCRATCPIQGAVFARVQSDLAPRRLARVQLLSVSVDALGDTPASLARWRANLGAGDAWRAAVPVPAQADRLLTWAGGNQPFAADSHTAQVLLFDDRARLVMRTTDLPDPAEVVRLMVELDARFGRG
jgi:protein SCO1/2